MSNSDGANAGQGSGTATTEECTPPSPEDRPVPPQIRGSFGTLAISLVTLGAVLVAIAVTRLKATSP